MVPDFGCFGAESLKVPIRPPQTFHESVSPLPDNVAARRFRVRHDKEHAGRSATESERDRTRARVLQAIPDRSDQLLYLFFRRFGHAQVVVDHEGLLCYPFSV